MYAIWQDHLLLLLLLHLPLTSLLLLDDFITDILPDFLQPCDLFSCEGLRRDLKSAGLELGRRLEEALKEFVRQHDGLDVCQPLAIGWGHFVVPEDLGVGGSGWQERESSTSMPAGASC